MHRKVAIVGSPNVGKSLLFGRLTGTYATVSNYPGTSVEVTRGRLVAGEHVFDVVDTPGMYSLLPLSEEERVARSILVAEKPAIVLHVVDAKNLERMLPLTFQLLEAGQSLILVLNMMDESEKAGVTIHVDRLEKELGIPVVPTAATTGRGLDELTRRIVEHSPSASVAPWEPAGSAVGAVRRIVELLKSEYGLAHEAVARLLLQGDSEFAGLLADREAPETVREVRALVDAETRTRTEPFSYALSMERQRLATGISERVMERAAEGSEATFAERLSRWMMRPLTGIPILLLVLYFGLYEFVGRFGAGVLVDWIETHVFQDRLNPWMIGWFAQWVPWPAIRDLFVGEYGVLTLGIRYAIGLIMPIVASFFLVFAIIEDTGYLPRLALLIDRVFKTIGLSGRAVIPMVLGLGCDTMATMVTRTLPTKRERVIATILLALAVPCSAQLGVILSLLEGSRRGLWVWAGVVSLVFLLIGFLSSKLLPGEAPSFYMEIPPLRLPRLGNVLIKTYTRMEWYFKEIIPIFVFASVLIWGGQWVGLFDLLVHLMEYPMRWLGLPDPAAVAFLFGFFRRDYGAAGLYDIKKAGGLDGIQLVTACVTLTLFLPCVAQFLMTVKERGLRTGLAISGFILVFSFTVGFVVNVTLRQMAAWWL